VTAHDPTEAKREMLRTAINIAAFERPALEAREGQVWDTQELQRDFTVHGFLAPMVSVTRKADGKRGVLLFQHLPRFYFNFQPMWPAPRPGASNKGASA